MADQVQDSLLREIDEELRQEKFAKLWKRFGGYILAGAVVLVLAVAGYQGWRAWDLKTRMAASDRFVAALAQLGDGKTEEARKAFDGLAADADAGYALLARLREASTLADSGDRAGAAKMFDEIAADSGTSEMFRDLATIQSVLLSIDGGDAAALNARLAPLAAKENPWRFNAQELMGLIAQRQGDVAKAKEIYQTLSQDPTAPTGVRSRAMELLAALG